MKLYDILEDYTKWLIEHDYCDDDVWAETIKAVDRFLSERKEYLQEFDKK